MKRFFRLLLLCTFLPLTGCEVCTNPAGCDCYMDNDGDGDGDSVTGRPVEIEEGEVCPTGYYL
ncbi:hypothetical protein EBT31_04140 [bacterium]|nr:hypothetical protein [bacterium]